MPNTTTLQDMELIRSLLGDLVNRPETLPVSFTYDGRRFDALPCGRSESRFLDANIVETRYTARLDKNVSLTAEIQTYRDFGAVEWTLWFENTGSDTSAMLEDVFAADMDFRGNGAKLISCNGDTCNMNEYSTMENPLGNGDVFEQAPEGGRPCNNAFPYQRLLFDGFGFSVSIGWPGQWSCRWVGTDCGAHFTAGQQVLHTVLKPGERVRSPRMSIVAFEGDLERGVNVWRRWYHAHVMPRSGGEIFPYLVQALDNGGGLEWADATEEQQLKAIQAEADSRIDPELWWIDAGWYDCSRITGERIWSQVGTWEPDPERFPNGMSPIGEACARNGMKFLLWYEPERVMLHSWLADHHPEWVMERDPADRNPDPIIERHLLDFSQDDCAKWMCEHVSEQIRKFGIKVFREDFNIGPLAFWRYNETEDRKGMIENRFIQNYLAFWDYLLLHNPDLMIDCCASGGRRNDLESMRRSVPFHQTDFGYGHNPLKQKFGCLMYSWIPYYRGYFQSWENEQGEYIEPSAEHPATETFEEFDIFNTFAPIMSTPALCNCGGDPEIIQRFRDMVALFKRVRHHMRDDFYALTEPHTSSSKWSAWQFHSPEREDGMLQFFRNSTTEQPSLTVHLRGLTEDAVYIFENGRTGETIRVSGRDAMEKGFTETLEKRRASLWTYKILQA